MKNLFCFGLILLLLTGCSVADDDNEFTFSEVNIKSTDEEVQRFISDVQEENGIYLFDDSGERWFVFLNSKMVRQGEQVTYFTNFDINSDLESANLYIQQDTTSDYAIKKLNNQVLYEVKLDKKYNYINLFRNNKEAHFSLVSGR